MRITALAATAAFLLAAPAAAQVPVPPQAALDSLAAGVGYGYAVIDNHPDCPPAAPGCFLATITLTLPDPLPASIPMDGLSLWFSFANPLPLVESDLFEHRLFNGDVQQLVLKPGAVLRPGSVHVIKLWGTGAVFSKAHAMPNAYLAANGLAARTIAATRPATDPATGLEVLPFVAPMTDEGKLATKSPDDRTRWLTAERAFAEQAEHQAPAATGVVILPKPVTATQPGGERIDLSRGVRVSVAGVPRSAVAPAIAALGVREGAGVPLAIRVSPAAKVPAEGYVLDVRAGGIGVTARDAAGASYALRSLAQQAAFEGLRMRPLHVEDAPRYGFRGLHVDLGRNFHDRAELLKLVEAMAAYKLNRLHLHLADDEGWRIAIPALPELTAIGSRRCHDPSETRCLMPQLGAGPDGTSAVNGFLSDADYVAIVRAAAARGIEVIPSIDMPGHSRAAIKSMEARYRRLKAAGQLAAAERYRLVDPADTTRYRSIQNYDDNTLNVCRPATYRFIDTVVDTLVALHRQARAPLRTFHLGADETAGAWVNSPACAAMIAENGGDAKKLTPRFIERVAGMLAKKGIETAGWSDGLGHTDPALMPKKVQTNIWGMLHTGAIRETHDQLNRGWDVVLSIPDLGYLDMPYAPHPEEGGYDWASRGVSTRQVFGFMPDNVPANTAIITNTFATTQPVPDEPRREPGRSIAGVQGQLWSETIRTDANVDYMLFPRLLALAERGWAPAPWTPPYVPGKTYDARDTSVDRAALEAGWRDFAGRLAAQLPLLDRMGVAYRVAPPGARVTRGRLEANAELPGTVIEYRSAAATAWQRYAGPVAVTGAVAVRARSADGRRASRTVEVR